MKGRKVTILFVPELEGTRRAFKVSRTAIQVGLILIALGFLFFLVMTFTWVGLLRKASYADALDAENQQFRVELTKVAELETRLQQLQTFEHQIRQALGTNALPLEEYSGSLPYAAGYTDTAGSNLYTPRAGSEGLPIAVQSKLPVQTRTDILASTEIPSLWPTDGFISRGFEWNQVVPGQSHSGVDIAGKEGAVIKATADGMVVWSGWSARYGNIVILAHRTGFFSVYGHNQVVLVQPRQTVTRGEPIALLGNTGQSSAPHLHFEIWYEDQPIDPLGMLVTS